MDDIRIMVVEDDIDLGELIRMYLTSEDWEVDVYNTGMDAIKAFNENDYKLIILDLMLGDISGFEICKLVREKSTIPIIMLTALEDSIYKVQGLNIGADDYMIKPFEPIELLARVKSQLRRAYEFLPAKANEDTMERSVGKLRLDKKKHLAYYKDEIIHLTAKEFEILWLLMEDADRVYSMDEIHRKIWGDEILEREVNPVMVHIRRIRSKFEKIGVESIITTVWGVGYKINA